MVQYGDAKTYCNGNFSGYTKLAGSQIKAGDVAIETAGSTGHIYVIKEVRGSVAQKVEANYVSGTIENDRFTSISSISCAWRKN
jgi:hypothetical protein